jgi:hypothetical protein
VQSDSTLWESVLTEILNDYGGEIQATLVPAEMSNRGYSDLYARMLASHGKGKLKPLVERFPAFQFLVADGRTSVLFADAGQQQYGGHQSYDGSEQSYGRSDGYYNSESRGYDHSANNYYDDGNGGYDNGGGYYHAGSDGYQDNSAAVSRNTRGLGRAGRRVVSR